MNQHRYIQGSIQDGAAMYYQSITYKIPVTAAYDTTFCTIRVALKCIVIDNFLMQLKK